MIAERKRRWIRSSLLFLAVFILIFAGLSLSSAIRSRAYKTYSLTLDGFFSDFSEKEKREALYSGPVFKKDRFIAFGAYARVPPGLYQGVFSVHSNAARPSVLEFQLASDKGKEVIFRERQDVSAFPFQKALVFRLSEQKEIEPRLLYISGESDLVLEKVVLERTRGLVPWLNIFATSLWGAVLGTLLVLSVWHTFQPSRSWKIYLAFFFLSAGFFLILRQAWISEDAFITLRHVDNFLDGYGPVFNPGERVEGYSHPFWLAILALFRLLGLSPKGSAVLPGLFLSLAALGLLFFKVRYPDRPRADVGLNPAAVVLIGVSAFIDFGTGGLETSLSYFLLVVLAVFLSGGKWRSRPLLTGLILTALVLTRPDFGVFLLFLIPFYVYECLKKRLAWKSFFVFLAFPVVFLGLHEVFRMGYYAALMPNPFYTKSGSSAYWAQGWKYLMDFGRGSLAFVILFLSALAVWISRRQGGLKNRMMVFSAGILYGFFIIRGGGDFMHGRFLLPSFLLISASAAGAFDRFFEKNTVFRNAKIVFCLALLALSLWVQPVQKRGVEISHGISNERYSYYKDEIIPVKYLLRDTMIFMWKTMGRNYQRLAEESRLNIRVAQTNVGFFGYYSGKHVYLIDRLGLTDPVIARIELETRTRPGHEKHAPFGYLMLRKLTFCDTPFPLWNEAAGTKFGVLWDLSPRTLKRLSPFVDPGIKEDIEKKIRDYLVRLEREELKTEAEFLFFLKEFWYPFASDENKALFEECYDEEIVIAYSTSHQWIFENRSKVETLLSSIQGPLNLKRFIQNIGRTLTRDRKIIF